MRDLLAYPQVRHTPPGGPREAARMTAGRGPVLPRWRDPAAYQRMLGIDRTGIMWEWLRRDPGYIAWYKRASRATCGPNPIAWGIYFRRGPTSRSA